LTVSWSDIQRERLRALGAVAATIEAQFDDVSSRNTAFQRFEKELVTEQKRRLQELRDGARRTKLEQKRRLQELRDGARRTKLSLLESRLTGALVDNGFVQVATPIIMSKGLLARMSIDEGHPLSSQVFWLDDKTCLRPMLAPHLYYVLKDLLRLWEKAFVGETGPHLRGRVVFSQGIVGGAALHRVHHAQPRGNGIGARVS